MKKAKKLIIIDNLIEEASKLTYDATGHSQASIINDTLSFIRNTLDEKNATVWEEKIKHIYWGVNRPHSVEFEQKRISRWHEGKDKFIDILKSIKIEIEQFSPDDVENLSSIDNTTNNDLVIFISHNSTDKLYGNALRNFITGLGVKNEQLIYTSHPMHKIPFDDFIYDYLRKNIHNNIFMIILWSDTYLDSPACLNEMGAAWVFQSDYSNIITPNLNFSNSKISQCAVDIRKMGIVLNGDDHCKTGMIELKNKIVSLFGLSVDEKQLFHLIDKFIEEIISIR
jgi:hypothetical protein